MQLLAVLATIVQLVGPPAASASAAPSAGSAPAASIPPVTVTAPKSEAMNTFIRALGETIGNGQLATWKDPVCPSIIGLKYPYSAYFAERLEDIAKSVGAAATHAACEPNIMIHFTKRPGKIVARLFRIDKRLFDDAQPDVDNLPPIYWRYGLEAAPADGSTGAVACTNGNCFFVVQHAKDSHLMMNAVYHLRLCIIVVDVTKTEGLLNSALASYISMIALAQISADADVMKYNSILNIFADRDDGRPGPSDITDWDLAYLKSLYASRGDIAWGEQEEMLERFQKIVGGGKHH